MNILTVDADTVNTRVIAWHGDVALRQAACQADVCDTVIAGSWTTLQHGVQNTTDVALQRAGFGMSQVDLVLMPDMITSSVDLHEAPHLVAPVGLRGLAIGMVQASIPEVCAQPIQFVPGVYNPVDNLGLRNIESMDMMRGRGVEATGLVLCLGIAELAVIVLSGSHLKFMHLDVDQRIAGYVTTLAGELFHVIAHDTILADALDSGFVTEVDPEMLPSSARSVSSIGLGRVYSMIRTLGQFTVCKCNTRTNSLPGAVLDADLLTLKNSSAIRMDLGTQFVITDKPLLREALAALMSDDDFFSGEATVTSSEQQEHLAGSGAIAIAREHGLVKALKAA